MRRQCGKPTCRCADGGASPHGLPAVGGGRREARAFHVPPAWAAEVRERVEMAKRLHEAAATMYQINLRRWLRQKAAARKPP